MARKRSSACIRCDGEGPLSKVGDHHFCEGCLAESRRHIYGTPAEPPVSSPIAGESRVAVKA